MSLTNLALFFLYNYGSFSQEEYQVRELQMYCTVYLYSASYQYGRTHCGTAIIPLPFFTRAMYTLGLFTLKGYLAHLYTHTHQPTPFDFIQKS